MSNEESFPTPLECIEKLKTKKSNAKGFLVEIEDITVSYGFQVFKCNGNSKCIVQT